MQTYYKLDCHSSTGKHSILTPVLFRSPALFCPLASAVVQRAGGIMYDSHCKQVPTDMRVEWKELGFTLLCRLPAEVSSSVNREMLSALQTGKEGAQKETCPFFNGHMGQYSHELALSQGRLQNCHLTLWDGDHT